MKRYTFHIVIVGFGDDIKQAWTNAIDDFTVDPGPIPNEDSCELYPGEGEENE